MTTVAPPIARLDEAMAGQGLYLTHSYRDDNDDGRGEFEVREYGDPLDGRAFTIAADGTIEETDR